MLARGVDFSVHTLDDAIRVLTGRTIAVLTGAGVSTDSGIPDYRGEGTVHRSPMPIRQFLESENSRRRYWAGSHAGWRRFSASEPNTGHRALAELEAAGVVTGIVTQNVDSLHRRAGSLRVVELHGRMDAVVCLKCGQHFARDAIARQLARANPMFEAANDWRIRPDGDVDAEDLGDFVVPSCTNCAGMLKPDVVFFGELVPRERFAKAFDLVHHSDALLVAGSSLEVNSGIRLLERALRQDSPIVIINRGKTKGDARATVRLEGGTSELLSELAQRL